MTDCSTQLKRTVPLYKVVNASIVDSYEDISKTQQIFSHWAARGLRKLDREVLKTGLRKVTLIVNRSTNTATLPPDFSEEQFIGVIINGKKIPLRLRPEIVDSKGVEDIPCEDKCEKCNQDKSICNDLTITEDTVLVTVNGNPYEQTIIKKLYPNGDYYLETRIPVWNIAGNTIEYVTTKELITALDLKPCGCIDETPANIEKIQCCCPDVYCSHFAPCDNSCTVDYGGYRIFEETGLIQFDNTSAFTKAYMEYWGFMPKKNGQYQVPEVAFETLVEWVKFKYIDGKRNIPNNDKVWRWNRYLIERKNMEKIKGRISLSQIIQAIGLIPKFDVGCSFPEPSGCVTTTTVIAAPISQAVCEVASAAVCPAPVVKGLTPFQLAVIAGNGSGTPQAGTNVYQNNSLKNAIWLNLIIVNNNNETILANQFSLDAGTGTITRYQGDGVTPNDWVAGDVLIANFSKII